MPAGLLFDDVGVMLQRRVRRQHVVIGIDDADVGTLLGHDPNAVQAGCTLFVVVGQGGKGVGHIGAPHAFVARLALCGSLQAGQVSAARRGTALRDAPGHIFHDRMENRRSGHWLPTKLVTKLQSEW